MSQYVVCYHLTHYIVGLCDWSPIQAALVLYTWHKWARHGTAVWLHFIAHNYTQFIEAVVCALSYVRLELCVPSVLCAFSSVRLQICAPPDLCACRSVRPQLRASFLQFCGHEQELY